MQTASTPTAGSFANRPWRLSSTKCRWSSLNHENSGAVAVADRPGLLPLGHVWQCDRWQDSPEMSLQKNCGCARPKRLSCPLPHTCGLSGHTNPLELGLVMCCPSADDGSDMVYGFEQSITITQCVTFWAALSSNVASFHTEGSDHASSS